MKFFGEIIPIVPFHQLIQLNNKRNIAHLKPVICPASELHLAVLVVEGEPGDVDLAGGHEDAGRDVCAQALVSYHNICRVGSVKGLTRAGKIYIS